MGFLQGTAQLQTVPFTKKAQVKRKHRKLRGYNVQLKFFLYINQLRITFVVGLIETLLRSCLGKVVSCQGIPVYGVGVALLVAYPFRFSLNHYVSLLVDWFIA